MGLRISLRAIYHRVETLTGVRRMLERSYARRFAHERIHHNAYCGVYQDFAAAQAGAPTTLPMGYDNKTAATLYVARTRYVLACDYPALFWLDRLFREGSCSVFDLGGHIGIKFYAFQRYLQYPDRLRWIVCELPAIVDAGVAWAREHDHSRRLAFTGRSENASGSDIMFASGSLQYLDYTLVDLIDKLPDPPRHVLVNVLPLHAEKSFFTVQNMGTLYCAYRIAAKGEFIEGMKKRGYSVRDQWDQPDRRCDIPFHPDHTVEIYYGFLFDRFRDAA